MNMFGLNPGVLPGIQRIFSEFLRQNAEDPAAEFFLPAALNQLVDDGELRIRTSRSDETWFGLTYSEDKQYARTRIADMIRHGRYPARLW